MNYFSYLYQCNMIRMFPLRAGVIGAFSEFEYKKRSCFPCVRGLSGRPVSIQAGYAVFPLRAGVIGFVNLQEPGSLSVSPVWGYRGTTD